MNKPNFVLSREQELKLQDYLQEAKNMVARTSRMDRQKVKEAIDFWYRLMNQTAPSIEFLDSPMALIKRANEVAGTEDYFYTSQFSNMWSSYYLYYKFMLLEVMAKNEKLKDQVEIHKDLLEHIEHLKEVHYIVSFTNVALVSDFPISISKITMGDSDVLHNQTGPSLEYLDGEKLYSLWGTKVPDWLITTSKQNINVADVMRIKNVETRLVAFKHLGAQFLLDKMNAELLDTKYRSETELEYELFKVDIEGEDVKMLKMKNPSVDEYHYEFVEPAANTVNDALAFRRARKVFVEPVFKT